MEKHKLTKFKLDSLKDVNDYALSPLGEIQKQVSNMITTYCQKNFVSIPTGTNVVITLEIPKKKGVKR